jgi:hypothetical protein
MLTTLTFRMDSVRGEVRAAPEPLPRRFRWRGHTYRRRRLIKKKLKESRRHGAFVNAYLPLRMPTMRDKDGTLFYVDAEHVLEPGAVGVFSGAKLSAGYEAKLPVFVPKIITVDTDLTKITRPTMLFAADCSGVS